jgi:hypothetical protein
MSKDLASFDPVQTASECIGQPELFGSAAIFTPDEANLIRTSLTYRHNGRTATRDEQRCLAIAAARLSGWSDRRIAEQMHVSRHTISRVVEYLERSGKLAPLKDRVLRGLGEVAESAVNRLREQLEDTDTLDPDMAGMIKSLSILAGIGADKLAAPAVGDLHLHLHQAGSGPTSQESASEYFEKLRRLQPDSKSGPAGSEDGTCIDIEPTVAVCESPNGPADLPDGARGLAYPWPPVRPAGSGPDAAGVRATVEGAGGGCAPAGAGEDGDGLPLPEFIDKSASPLVVARVCGAGSLPGEKANHPTAGVVVALPPETRNDNTGPLSEKIPTP